MVIDAPGLKREVSTIKTEIDKLGSDLEARKKAEKIGLFSSKEEIETFISNALPGIQETLGKNGPKLQSLLKDTESLRKSGGLSPEDAKTISSELSKTLSISTDKLSTLHKYWSATQKPVVEGIQKQIKELQSKIQVAFFGSEDVNKLS